MVEKVNRPVIVDYGDIIKEIQMVESEVNIVVDHIRNMPKNGLMVEWGSGGSTCKWIDTLSDDQKLISIEHNESWFDRVSRATKKHFPDLEKKFKYYHIPEQYDFQHGYATILEEHPFGLDNYVNPEDDNVWNADIFFIDGIARATCLMNVLLRRTKKDSVIFMHDYVGREEWYNWSVQLCNKETYDSDTEIPTLCKLFPKI